MSFNFQAEEWYNSRNPNNKTKVEFNVCLLNYYQDGSQRIGWHSDREELGRSTPIVSISLGTSRQFLIRSKTDGIHDRASITMTNGSMIVMENICQLKYLHSVPKESEVKDGRINLTFRCKEQDGEGTTAGELEHEKRDHWITQISTEEGVLDSTAGAWKQKQKKKDVNKMYTMATSTSAMMAEDDGGVGQVFGDNALFYDPACHSEEQISKSVEYIVKTNIGAESYCAAELEEVVDIERYYLLARPFGIAGCVAICRINDETGQALVAGVSGGVENEEERVSKMEGVLLQLRTAHHILRYIDHFDLNDVLSSLAGAAQDNETLAEKSNETSEDGEAQKVGSITGEMLYEYYKERLVSGAVSIPSLANLQEGGTFRTSCERIGTGHGFQAPEVERYAKDFSFWYLILPQLTTANAILLFPFFYLIGRWVELCQSTTHISNPK